MITLISATSRLDSMTAKVCFSYSQLLDKMDVDHQVFKMSELQSDNFLNNLNGGYSASLSLIVEKYFKMINKFIVVSPEYHGSYPGLFKALIDCIDVKHFKSKKIALVGISSGRAGNIRGIDHLTSIFHHLKAEVFSNKLKLSRINKLVNEFGEINDIETLKMIEYQINGFSNF